MKIEGAVALVTGGASGLGEATVRRLVADGAKAVIVDMNEERGEAVAKELGDGVVFQKTDVSDEAQVQAAVDAAKKLGDLRVAVNCAGVGWAARTLKRDGTPHDFDLFKKVISVNLVGTFNVIRLAASAMSQNEPLEGERGVIVNTASIAAFDGQIGQAAYAASKGGVVGLTLPVARDLSKAQIRVCTIAPGTFDTPMLAGLPEEVRQALAAGIPNPARLGDPKEYAALAKHIVENGYLNAEVIRLDGALRMPPK
ncbi:MAG TPA: 3-hydroxyacyl-CoA dehydrogenase [Polyangiaceae bacterium LLY-WYZ-15_(1-7)]|nr:3-hydroxyacyl-CoA dehydrogenase [Myxococcales bacterium]MAT27959.1 3-hydroxyacyl-CoA dehydrogenase [Sandaracinus sp.]HJL06105.1 3-hydroxyacyl-CoA dehydrogenase [Polyangiaceae bacterium LLY-WYZ-15_(1-7)]MBJ71233.1 3-hydroxyacyl-CoA dehydrogenase [Sandaracinus sp.]HJL06969.1 3-hydroxyacyl-CoA dehydrogenase [Polyangiaceae bacterium LLY-WYZ-15_(1-7)]